MAFFDESGTLFVVVKVYISPAILAEISDPENYVLEIITDINILFKKYRLPLRFIVFSYEWEVPGTGTPEHEKAEKYARHLCQKIGGSTAVFFKLLFCLLLNQVPRQKEDISVLFVGGRLAGSGGVAMREGEHGYKNAVVATGKNRKTDSIIFAHELLHLLELPHNGNENSLMYGCAEKFALDKSDKRKIKEFVEYQKQNKKKNKEKEH